MSERGDPERRERTPVPPKPTNRVRVQVFHEGLIWETVWLTMCSKFINLTANNRTIVEEINEYAHSANVFGELVRQLELRNGPGVDEWPNEYNKLLMMRRRMSRVKINNANKHHCFDMYISFYSYRDMVFVVDYIDSVLGSNGESHMFEEASREAYERIRPFALLEPPIRTPREE